jgi:hypothetical protein
VVIDEGLQDLLQAGNSTTVEPNLSGDGYNELAAQLNAWGINVILTTLTPCSGYTGSGTSPEDTCTTGTAPTVDANRTDLNTALDAQFSSFCFLGPCIEVADFDAAVTNGSSPEALVSTDDSGDHVNLSSAGYAAVTGAVPVSQLLPNTPPQY